MAPGRPDRIARVIDVPVEYEDYELTIDVDQEAYTAIVQGGPPSLSLGSAGERAGS